MQALAAAAHAAEVLDLKARTKRLAKSLRQVADLRGRELKDDAQRAKAETKRDAQTASLVWQMMAKRHACGRSTLREEDRVYLVLERSNRAARYCFFSAQDTWGRARDALGMNGTLARSDGATASASDTLGALRARGWLENFAVVRFVDAPCVTAADPVIAAPAAPPAAAPIDATPAPPAPHRATST